MPDPKASAPSGSTTKGKTRLVSKGSRKTLKHNVLVTGATSTIGRQLVVKLIHDPNVDKVWAFSRRERPYYFSDLPSDRFTFHRVAPLNVRRLQEICTSPEFQAANIDTIVHLGFQVGYSGDLDTVRDYNIKGTQNLLNLALEQPSIRKFIFLSSAKVFRLHENEPVVLTESSELDLSIRDEPYVKDLIEADILCQHEISRRKLQMLILRPSYVIGRNVHSFFSYYFDSPLLLRVMNHNPMVNLVHSGDVIRAIRMSVASETSGVLNIVGRETLHLKDFIALTKLPTLSVPERVIEPAWQAVRRLRFNRHPFPFRAARPLTHHMLLSGVRAKEEIGYEPEHHVKFDARP
ncbi:MAG: NAD-dependent epimerase/dehydratase family protein [Deltaproteobacteria bacterium]|nr:NAD-dependent epimerase/dehydratase family protein [Deltaproteobacteria bacterium]